MYQEFYVNKTTNTYSDTLEMFGLCVILEDVLHQLNKNESILIRDIGHSFELTLKDGIEEDELNKIKYKQYHKYFLKRSKDREKLKENIKLYDYQKQKEVSDNYWKQIRRKKNDKNFDESNLQKPSDIHSNFTVLITLNADAVNNKLLDKWSRDDHTTIIKLIFDYYNKLNKMSLSLKEDISKVQLFNPFCGKGVNNKKTLNISPKTTKGIWLFEFLKIVGYYEIALPKIVSGDVKVFCVVPKNIYWSDLKAINRNFDRLLSSRNSVVLYDILFILEYINNLIKYSVERKEFLLEIFQKQQLVSGFQSAYFKNMGQVKSLANINFYRFPSWVKINDEEDTRKYKDLLSEHKEIISRIDEEEILLSYRDFLSSEKFDDLIDFLSKYSIYLMQALSNKKYYIKPFLINNLYTLMSSINQNYLPILQNEGFRNIAKAIRNVTVKAQYSGGKPYSVYYGMAQDLKRKSLNKKDLVNYLSEFVGLYNNENVRVFERTKAQKRKNITTSDIENIITLIDEYGSELVGKLLLAFGYAKEEREESKEE